MIITTLSHSSPYYKEVADMIYHEFVVGTTSTKTAEDVEQFFKNTNAITFPITFVAILQDECIGTVSIFESDYHERPQYKPWLASLFVKPQYRSQKVGYQLISYLLNYLIELGFHEVYLKTENVSNYYQERGWQLVESIQPLKDEPFDIFKYKL